MWDLQLTNQIALFVTNLYYKTSLRNIQHVISLLGSYIYVYIYTGICIPCIIDNYITCAPTIPQYNAYNGSYYGLLDLCYLQSLVEHGAKVNIADYQGNTSLHVLCGDKANTDSAPDCISVLVCPYFPLLHTPINTPMIIMQVSKGARLDIQNNQVC